MPSSATLPRPASSLRGSTTPRIYTPPLAAGPPGPCGCGCALTPATTRGFEAVDFATDVVGLGLMPWQRWLFIHALETLPGGHFRHRTVLVLVARQNGKALDCETPILTANRGWTTMRDVETGDEVFHPGGHPTAVTGAFDVMTDRRCYRVTTTDGRSLVADADHLWTVQDRRRSRSRGPRGSAIRHHEWETLTTGELLTRGLMRSTRTRPGGGVLREFAFRLPVQRPVISKPVDLPIDPYLFGAWLGDGTSDSACLTVGEQDLTETVALVESAGAWIVSRKRDRRCWRLRFNIGPMRDGFEARARALGVWGAKHVPDTYLTAGVEQRLALLQGLLDTDGGIDTAGKVEFCSTSRALADAVLYLARSLGWRATAREPAATLRGREVGRRWRVCFTPVEGDAVPFRLARKARRVQPSNARGGELHAVSIASIEPVGPVPVRCIKVAAPDGLYLAGRGLLATHNTTWVEIKNLWKMYVLRVPLVIGTAQNLDISEESWDKAVEIAESVPDLAAEIAHVDKTNGKKALKLVSGSRWKIAAASRKGGRGLSGDDVNLDELREHHTWESWAAVTKTTMARAFAQIWAITNAGDDRSVVLNSLHDSAIAALEDPDPDAPALFEWSAPDDCPIDDPEMQALANPSLGYPQGITLGALRSALKTDPEPVFRTECLCQRVPDLVPSKIPLTAWVKCADPASKMTGGLVLSWGVSWDRSRGVIGIAGYRADGIPHLEVVDYRQGTDWIAGRIGELVKRHQILAVVFNPSGPGASILTEVTDRLTARLEPKPMTARDQANACGRLYDAAMTGPTALRHLGDDRLLEALRKSATRTLVDAWAWDMRASAGEISPLTVVTDALHGLYVYGKPPAVAPSPIVTVVGGTRNETGDLHKLGF